LTNGGVGTVERFDIRVCCSGGDTLIVIVFLTLMFVALEVFLSGDESLSALEAGQPKPKVRKILDTTDARQLTCSGMMIEPSAMSQSPDTVILTLGHVWGADTGLGQLAQAVHVHDILKSPGHAQKDPGSMAAAELPRDGGHVRLTKSRGRLGQCFEHDLQIEGRAQNW
jgi:hypothetical protein